jgi:transcription elongation factor GreB
LERIRRELAWLQKVERPRMVREVAYAASLGDRSDNAEYKYGKGRLREIDRRMRYLMGRLDHVQPIDPAAQTGESIKFGATVVVADEEGVEQTWRLFGEDEVAVEHGILSFKSPLGGALLGKREGDEVQFDAPRGRRVLEIVTVRYDAQPPLREGLDAWKDPVR